LANFHYDTDMLVDGLVNSGELDAFLADAGRYALMCSENRRIEDTFASTHVSAATKAVLIETLVVPFFGPTFAALMKRFQVNGDLQSFTHIIERIRASARSRLGVCFADVASSVPLTESELTKIENHLAKLCGHRVYVGNIVDHELIGGFMITIEGKMIDLSVRGDLLKMKILLLEENR